MINMIMIIITIMVMIINVLTTNKEVLIQRWNDLRSNVSELFIKFISVGNNASIKDKLTRLYKLL